MKNIILLTILGLGAVMAIAECDPPTGHPTSCRSIGVTPGSGGWAATGNMYGWGCCNQNFSCPTNGVNPGYWFLKTVNQYSNGTSTCYDYDNITNWYPTPSLCCAIVPPEA